MVVNMLIILVAAMTLLPGCLLAGYYSAEAEKDWPTERDILFRGLKLWVPMLIVMEVLASLIYII